MGRRWPRSTASLRSGERLGNHYAYGRCLNTLGWIYGELQDHEQALVCNAQALQAVLAMPSPDPEALNNTRLNLGDNLLALGRLDEAEQQLQAVERVVRQPQPDGTVYALALRPASLP